MANQQVLSEAQIKKAILQWLQMKRKCEAFPTITGGVFNPQTGKYRRTATRKGTPDILCCYRGLFLAIEVKTQKGRLSPEQRELIQSIENTGGQALVARSIEDVENFFSDIDQKFDSSLL